MSTQSGEFEDGAEVYLLSDEDLNHNFVKDFFQIKLGYNCIHHYFPIVPKGVMQFFHAFNSVTHYSINLRKVLKSLSNQAPSDTNFQKLVSIAHQNNNKCPLRAESFDWGNRDSKNSNSSRFWFPCCS